MAKLLESKEFEEEGKGVFWGFLGIGIFVFLALSGAGMFRYLCGLATR
jgi:hypothetical protein